MSEEWSEWRLHDGSGQPCPDGMDCEICVFDYEDDDYYGPYLCRTGERVEFDIFYCEGNNEDWLWIEKPDEMWITQYRIKKPKGLTILQRIAEQPETEVVGVC